MIFQFVCRVGAIPHHHHNLVVGNNCCSCEGKLEVQYINSGAPSNAAITTISYDNELKSNSHKKYTALFYSSLSNNIILSVVDQFISSHYLIRAIIDLEESSHCSAHTATYNRISVVFLSRYRSIDLDKH